MIIASASLHGTTESSSMAFRHLGEAQQLYNSMEKLYTHIQRMSYVTDVQGEIWEKIVSL